ncbi:hypothetical protein LCGC14_0364840 [marine sediment metagenome]|uniref:Major capsid protein n=1 Tax=marine sediment metagenome TaxID=412755 RepID=A0A0F9TPV8_9ZZZZ
MPDILHGSGTIAQFTSGDKRNFLEMGPMIHMFNPSDAPILSIGSRAHKRTTPVAEFYHMEDEFFVRKSETFTMASSANLKDSNVSGINDTGCILVVDRLPQLELFEVGGVYTAVKTGSAGLESMLAYMVVAIGQEVSFATPTDKMVQFVGIDTISAPSYTYDKHSTGVAILTSGASGTLTLTYVGNAGLGSLSSIRGREATQINLTDNDVFPVRGLTGHAEGGALSNETRKKVRRIQNCTQIFKESYEITNSEIVEKMYGGPELTRRSGRKLKKLRTDIEWAMITNGALSLDATAQNPQRTFMGLGVGGSAGAIQSNNADINSDLQLTEASFDMDDLDTIFKILFQDEDGSQTRDLFCGVDFLTAVASRIRQETEARFDYTPGTDSRAGLRVTGYHAPIGDMNFIPHKLLRGSLAKYCVAIDWSNYEVRPKRGRELYKEIDCVRDGRDGQVDEWRYEGGVEIRHENSHSIIKMV